MLDIASGVSQNSRLSILPTEFYLCWLCQFIFYSTAFNKYLSSFILFGRKWEKEENLNFELLSYIFFFYIIRWWYQNQWVSPIKYIRAQDSDYLLHLAPSKNMSLCVCVCTTQKVLTKHWHLTGFDGKKPR